MKASSRLAWLALASAGCAGVRPPAPPSAFPLSTTWTAVAPSAIEGPLAADEQRIFVATRGGTLVALRQEDGVEAWRAEAPGLVSAAPGRLVVRSPEGRLASLQPRAGGLRWSVESGVPGTLPAVVDRDLVFVGGQGLAAFDAETGAAVWRASEAATATSAPVVAGTRLLVGESDGTLRARDRATGQTLWTLRTREALRAPVFVDAEGELLLGTTDGRLLRLRPDRGGQRWRWKVGADVVSEAAAPGGLALFTSFDATLYALQRGSGKLAWRAGLPSRPLSGPLVAGGTVLVTCHENEIVGFGLADGKASGNLKLPAEIRTPPLLRRGRLHLGLRDRSVVALELSGLASGQP